MSDWENSLSMPLKPELVACGCAGEHVVLGMSMLPLFHSSLCRWIVAVYHGILLHVQL